MGAAWSLYLACRYDLELWVWCWIAQVPPLEAPREDVATLGGLGTTLLSYASVIADELMASMTGACVRAFRWVAHRCGDDTTEGGVEFVNACAFRRL